MKYQISLFFLVAGLTSCTPMKLTVPDVFKEQATSYHVSGSHRNKMSFDVYSTSRIRRGLHVQYPGWSRIFFPENLVYNKVGHNKQESVMHEKAKFHYKLSDGHTYLEVFGKERDLKRNLEYSLENNHDIFNYIRPLKSSLLSSQNNFTYVQPQEHRYIFSAVIKTDTLVNGNSWELIMSNVYERENDTTKSLFSFIRLDDNGFATNGVDSIFIKPVTLKNAEGPGGQKSTFPIKLLIGYELNTLDGVIAIIDLVDSNVWLYNELNAKERLVIAGITTALFARKVKDAKW